MTDSKHKFVKEKKRGTRFWIRFAIASVGAWLLLLMPTASRSGFVPDIDASMSMIPVFVLLTGLMLVVYIKAMQLADYIFDRAVEVYYDG